jgi:hypothetical protein
VIFAKCIGRKFIDKQTNKLKLSAAGIGGLGSYIKSQLVVQHRHLESIATLILCGKRVRVSDL